MTVAEAKAKAAQLSKLSQELFLGGKKAGGLLKAVHLDLEAKGIVPRHGNKPIRLVKTGKWTSSLIISSSASTQPISPPSWSGGLSSQIGPRTSSKWRLAKNRT